MSMRDLTLSVISPLFLFILFGLSGCGSSSSGGGGGGGLTFPPGTVYYVSSAAADDTGDGLSPGAAKQTINAAIQQSVTDMESPAVVVINAGTYMVDSAAGTDTHVVMVEGVSLYGGYNAGFTARDPDMFISTIQDTSADMIGGYALTPNRAVEVGTGITAATIIDGLTINGTSSVIADYGSAVAIHNGADVTLRNSVLNGGAAVNNAGIWIAGTGTIPDIYECTINGGSGTYSRGIFALDQTTALIHNNTFNGGTASASSYGIVVLDTGTDPDIETNVIDGGSGAVNSFGISLSNSASGLVSANTITGGTSASNSVGVVVASGATATIEQNDINGGTGGSTSFGVMVNNGSPTIQNNSSIHGGTSANTTAISAVNSSSVLIQQNSLINGGAATNAAYAIIGSGNSVFTVRDNAHINGGSGMFSYAINLQTASSSSVIERNRIFGGNGTTLTFGVYDSQTGVPIHNNLIHGGTSNNSYGIQVFSANNAIRNNTIFGGSTNSSTGINMQGTAALTIENNIIYTRASVSGLCINEDMFASADAAVIANNNFSGCTYTVYRDFDGGCTGDGDGDANNETCTLAEMEALSGAYQNNTEDDATQVFVDEDGADNNLDTLADNNWHLNTAVGNIADGGLNGNDIGGWGFTDDFDGVTRPAAASGNWSLGAYEHP